MSTRSSRSRQPAKSNLQVTPGINRIEIMTSEQKTTDPANLETEAPNEDPTPAPEATAAEKIQTDIREKLANRSVDENVFIPTNPVALEKAAEQIAKECGFEFNRGTAIGARLMARAKNRF